MEKTKEQLTWKCDSCKKERLDEFISVLSFPIKSLPGAVRNFKYCNDHDACYWLAVKAAKRQKI